MSGDDAPAVMALQALDLEGDRLEAERRALPERRALEEAAAQAKVLAQQRTGAKERREALAAEEATIDATAVEVRQRAREIETHLYSGEIKVARELEALQEEFSNVRARLEEIEDGQLAMMERGEGLDAEVAAIDAAGTALDERRKELEQSLLASEARVDAELSRLAGLRGGFRPDVPPAVLTSYDRLRGMERLRGKVVGWLEGGSCGSCRTDLPVSEARRAQAAPAEEPVQCPHCRRLMLRRRVG